MVCVDRLDPGHLSSGEHLCRWVLQCQRATRRSPKAPSFDGLDAYMRHVQMVGGTTFAPACDRHVADIQKSEGMNMKNERLAKEELEADNKRSHNQQNQQPGGSSGDGAGTGNRKTKKEKRDAKKEGAPGQSFLLRSFPDLPAVIRSGRPPS